MILNKKGEVWSGWGPLIVFIIIITISVLVIVYAPEAKQVWQDRMGEPSVSFGDVWKNKNFAFFDYIFGKIPSHLATWRENAPDVAISASIITLAIWLLFVLTFGDIMTTFGFFSKAISWVTAVILAIIAANIQLLKFVSVVGLSVTAMIGTTSVLLSILWVFVLFILFHFGGGPLRDWIISRRRDEETLMGLRDIRAGMHASGEMGRAARRERRY